MATVMEQELEVSKWTARDAMFVLHGAMLLVAFILVFPAGIIAIKLSSSKAFQYHWMVQAAAFFLTAAGVIIGLVLSPNIRSSKHKQLGVIVGFLLAVQLVSGWRHHVIFSKTYRHTWVSKIHTWLGRFIIGAGWCNLVIGLSLGGFADTYVYLAAAIVCIEAIALALLNQWYHEAAHVSQKVMRMEQRRREGAENYFALDEDDSDD